MGKKRKKGISDSKGEKQAKKIIWGIAAVLLALVFLFYMILV